MGQIDPVLLPCGRQPAHITASGKFDPIFGHCEESLNFSALPSREAIKPGEEWKNNTPMSSTLLETMPPPKISQPEPFARF